MTEKKDIFKIESNDIVSTVPSNLIKIESSDVVPMVQSAAVKIESSGNVTAETYVDNKTALKGSNEVRDGNTGDSDFSKEFSGLPIENLICDPILGVAHGQEKLCNAYLDTLFKLAYEGKEEAGQWVPDPTKPIRQISFLLNRPFINESGTYETSTVQVNAPLLSLVPIPAFTMDEITVEFRMEIKDHKLDTNEKDATGKIDLKGSRYGIGATISGSVTAKASQTRGTDRTATYDITARAIQHPPAEGMAKLTSLFASVIEPLPPTGN